MSIVYAQPVQGVPVYQAVKCEAQVVVVPAEAKRAPVGLIAPCVAMFGLILAFGGQVHHIRELGSLMDKLREAAGISGGQFSIVAVQRVLGDSPLQGVGILGSISHANDSTVLIIGGMCLFAVAALTFIARYKGIQRGLWISCFLTALFAQLTGFFLRIVFIARVDDKLYRRISYGHREATILQEISIAHYTQPTNSAFPYAYLAALGFVALMALVCIARISTSMSSVVAGIHKFLFLGGFFSCLASFYIGTWGLFWHWNMLPGIYATIIGGTTCMGVVLSAAVCESFARSKKSTGTASIIPHAGTHHQVVIV